MTLNGDTTMTGIMDFPIQCMLNSMDGRHFINAGLTGERMGVPCGIRKTTFLTRSEDGLQVFQPSFNFSKFVEPPFGPILEDREGRPDDAVGKARQFCGLTEMVENVVVRHWDTAVLNRSEEHTSELQSH